eukprot:763760-Hanusia_phi.AAC.2
MRSGGGKYLDTDVRRRTIAVEVGEVEIESNLKESFGFRCYLQRCDGICEWRCGGCQDLQVAPDWAGTSDVENGGGE